MARRSARGGCAAVGDDSTLLFQKRVPDYGLVEGVVWREVGDAGCEVGGKVAVGGVEVGFLDVVVVEKSIVAVDRVVLEVVDAVEHGGFPHFECSRGSCDSGAGGRGGGSTGAGRDGITSWEGEDFWKQGEARRDTGIVNFDEDTVGAGLFGLGSVSWRGAFFA